MKRMNQFKQPATSHLPLADRIDRDACLSKGVS